MKLEIKNIGIYSEALVPSLIVTANITTNYNIEYPSIITGEILCKSKVISVLQLILPSRNEYKIKNITSNEQSTNYKENRQFHFNFYLIAELNQHKIEYIEKIRNSNQNKSVTFSIRLRTSAITIPYQDSISNHNYTISNEELFETITVNQETWIQRFSKALGIGDFYLIELAKPKTQSQNNLWEELYEEIIGNLNEMEDELKLGNWRRVIEVSRSFFENIKIGDPKEGSKKYKEDLIERMKHLGHSDKGVKNLLDGIWKFFDYTSKFIHSKDTEGNLRPIPDVQKSDAYFIYSLSINLTNLIYDKINTSR